MAQNLYKKLGDSCDSFRVFDTNPESVKAFCTAFPKAVPVESVKELAQHSNVIITMLPAAVRFTFDAFLYWNMTKNLIRFRNTFAKSSHSWSLS